jgi:hypothetical protein
MQVLRSELPSYQGNLGAPAPNTVGAFDEPNDSGQVRFQKQLHNQNKCPGPVPRFVKSHDCNPRKEELVDQQQSVQSIRVEAEGSLLKPALKREENAGRESRSVRVHWYANEREPNRTSEGTTQTSPTSATGLQRGREQGSAESERNAEKHEMPPRISPEGASCKSREAPATNVETVETATQTSSEDRIEELVDEHKKEEELVRPLEKVVGAREIQSTKKKVALWRGDREEVLESPEKAVAGGRREKEASGVDIHKESTCRGASLINDQAQHRRKETNPLSHGVIVKSVGKARVMRAWK